MRKERAAVAGLMAVMLLQVGCAGRGTQVRCDGRLEPINAPAPRGTVSEGQGSVLGSADHEQ